MMRLKHRLDNLVRELQDIKKSIPDDDVKLGTHPDHYNPLYFSHSDWGCEYSPTKYCMYTRDRDSCIFCWQPDERK